MDLLPSLKRLSFRGRLFVILLLFALVPSIVLTAAWAATSWLMLPLAGATAAWDSAAASGARALAAARQRPHSTQAERAFRAHEQTLRESLARSKQAGYVFRRAAVAAAVLALLAFAILFFVTSRVAGHLSRNLSRPLQELVGWTDVITRGASIPASSERGAPEFGVLRERMREMSSDIERGRRAALEAERLSAMRESARQVAHELKNPLTPIRFAVARLRRDAPPPLQDAIEVLATESTRLEELAHNFAQFGRLPEGPAAPVDLGELARYTARSLVPPGVTVDVDVDDGLPLIQGHHDALSRAAANIVLNAVDAVRANGGSGGIVVSVRSTTMNGDGKRAVSFEVTDTGCGIPADRLARIWEPYVTYKAGGTGLGLAIVRQTVQAHGGQVRATSEPGRGTTIQMLFQWPAS